MAGTIRHESSTTTLTPVMLNVPWGAELPDATTSLLGQQYQEMINYGDSVGEDGVQYVPSVD